MTKLLRFQSLALVAGMGLFGLIAGCNPDEPAKPANPPPTTGAVKPATPPKSESTAPAPVTPPKTESEKKKM